MSEPAAQRAAQRAAAVAGHTGDERSARDLLGHGSGATRAAALGALARMGALAADDVAGALADADPAVRRRACEEAAHRRDVDLRPLLRDPDSTVVEVAAWALGEQTERPAGAVDVLVGLATGHDDALCREAAVAALGAIGDERGLSAVLAATADRATVRRRAVIALAAFAGEEVEATLQAALSDRDWQVRQAAEDLLSDRRP